MYRIAVVGTNPTARASILACQLAGFDDITWVSPEDESNAATAAVAAKTLPANLTRLITALGGGKTLLSRGHIPDREQVRFAASGYLLSELPLGKFAQDRYGAPHVNIADADLNQALGCTNELLSNTGLDQLANSHEVVLVCADPLLIDPEPTHELWQAKLAVDATTRNANVTWLGHGQTGWQFSTPEHTHYVFSTPVDVPLEKTAWHASLHEAIDTATLVGSFNTAGGPVRDHWQEGNVAYLGEACYGGNIYRRESLCLGLEDAWVVSRMLENYEEDIFDGLAEYERYRRPRTKKVARTSAEVAAKQVIRAPLLQVMRNLDTAFSTRFMPEIAMQRIDWLYNYDCIRGFR
jgi:hypothetical protein